MLVLGIESTCDETSAALVRSGQEIVRHIIASQASVHNRFGGVVPEIASRHHIDDIIPVITECLEGLSLKEIDLICVANEPGLIGSLLVGMQTAKALAWGLDKPVIGINHVEAHLYASMMGVENLEKHLPALGLILSGGHSTLLRIEEIGTYSLIGQTVDDAVGEAFDKAAKILSLGYPGGPEVEKKAKRGDPFSFPFRAGHVKRDPYSFSFSGLKTALLYTAQKVESTEQTVCDLCASFQQAAFSNLIQKLKKACDQYRPKALFLGGGVTQNKKLRSMLSESLSLPLFWPSPSLCLDNAAMIAGLGYHKWKKNSIDMRFSLEPKTRISWNTV